MMCTPKIEQLIKVSKNLRACKYLEKNESQCILKIYQNQQDMQTKYTRLTNSQCEVVKEFLNWQRKRSLDLRNVLMQYYL